MKADKFIGVVVVVGYYVLILSAMATWLPVKYASHPLTIFAGLILGIIGVLIADLFFDLIDWRR